MPDFQWYPLNFHLIKNVEYASKNVQFGYNYSNTSYKQEMCKSVLQTKLLVIEGSLKNYDFGPFKKNV